MSFILSCNSETETIDTATFGYGYFPLKKGQCLGLCFRQYHIYEWWRSKRYLHALIMEEIGDPFLDLSGDTIL
ncbi:MAG: hypothetical protein IPN46_11550 [Saprospiraceae bacterium]|nr:hypothetical protein [Saprospiraceae bacterium]